MEWEAIETAPRDGSFFMGWHKVHKCAIAISFMAGKNTLAKNDIYIEKTKATFWPMEAFTHWMPLPKPPES